MATTSAAGNDSVWGDWTSTATDSSTVTTNSVVWENWVMPFVDNTATSVWYSWTDVTATQGTSSYGSQIWYQWTDVQSCRVISTRESSADRTAREQREKERAADEQRAKQLLEETITEEEKEAFRTKKVIPITAKSGRHYQIKQGRVERVVNGKAVASYCIDPGAGYPVHDVMLSQYCWLKWCEEDFLKTANETPVPMETRQAA